jgi:hypothetical protein
MSTRLCAQGLAVRQLPTARRFEYRSAGSVAFWIVAPTVSRAGVGEFVERLR